MLTLSNLLFILPKAILLAVCAPLVSGVIQKIKNNVRMRKGPSMFQPYYNVQKLFAKDEVVSKNTSWIFDAAPLVVIASSFSALFLILIVQPNFLREGGMAILIAAFFVLALGRFFLALAGLDAASSFGGMGSSREMFIASFVEPVVFIGVFVLWMGTGDSFRASNLLAGFAILMAAIAETSRIPVDNQETHLELTMIHEAMVLEYSGRSLALIELASHIKQMTFFVILSWYLFPLLTVGNWDPLFFSGKILVIALTVALIEISVAKMRLFRAVDFLSFSFLIALLAAIIAGIGL